MSTMEIVLLVIGIIFFIAGFVIPEKAKGMTKEDMSFGKEQVKSFVSDEVSGMKLRVEELVEETVTYSVEKAERMLERISNEKIMAVNEYSDTVLKEINRNHEEVMFLYDMLTDKQKSMKATVSEAEQVAKSVSESVQNVTLQMAQIEQSWSDKVVLIADQTPIKEKKETKRATSKKAEQVNADDSAQKETDSKSIAKESKTTKIKEKPKELNEVEIQFASGGPQEKNNNKKILELRKSGKSNMAIAKELGLGVGEVKLVIDLFEGI